MGWPGVHVSWQAKVLITNAYVQCQKLLASDAKSLLTNLGGAVGSTAGTTSAARVVSSVLRVSAKTIQNTYAAARAANFKPMQLCSRKRRIAGKTERQNVFKKARRFPNECDQEVAGRPLAADQGYAK